MENSASGQSRREANSSIQNEFSGIPEISRTRSGNENEQFVIDINSMVQTSEILLSNGCRIRKVPRSIRMRNNEAYTPQLSIGPYHHSYDDTASEKGLKVSYCLSFVRRAENGISRWDLETTIGKMEHIIRRCYANSYQLDSFHFVRMIVIDATFILELFLKCNLGDWDSNDNMRLEHWLLRKVHRDLVLLENQLPFFVLKKLYHLALPSFSKSVSLIQLTFEFFKSWNVQQKAPEGDINHFTELLRFFALPPHDKLPGREPRVCFPRCSATDLHVVGVRFREVSSKSVLDLSFNGGVLGIPPLYFVDDTEALVLNILALEQCCHTDDRYITDFYLILGRLIKTDNDVKFLSEMGIIYNSLSDDNEITSMVKNFSRGISTCNMNSNLFRVCEELNAFCDDPWNRRKVSLRRRYWDAISASAVILVLLTLLQTVCSIIQIVPIVKSL